MKISHPVSLYLRMAGKCLLACMLIAIFSACTTPKTTAYFFSPLNGAVPVYRPSITNFDSLASAIDLSGTVIFGSANEDDRDDIFSFNSAITRSHAFKHIGLRYGVNVHTGNYKIAAIDPASGGETVDADYINQHAKGYFFGSFGTDGAVHFAANGKKVEFRIIGFEWSLNKEFGNYASFRKATPQSKVTLRDTTDFYGTAGGFSEVIMKPGNSQVALRFGMGHALGNIYKDFDHPEYPEPYDRSLRFKYHSFAVACSKGPYSFFIQFIECEKATSGNIGGSVRLNAKKRKSQ
jgi:hypothetical protein